jgi:hypothetical protein
LKYSAAVDCYALGCVVYQMFHGSTPHFSADEDEQLDKIVEGGLAYPREPFGQVQESADRMQRRPNAFDTRIGDASPIAGELELLGLCAEAARARSAETDDYRGGDAPQVAPV